MKNTDEFSVKELTFLLKKMKKRLSVSNHSQQTIINYLRSVEYLCIYTGKHPKALKLFATAQLKCYNPRGSQIPKTTVTASKERRWIMNPQLLIL